jgi:DNA-binding PadR family transcriptional regulator
MTIQSELWMREFGPTEFLEEFGGGSYGSILGHFRRLEEHGWIRRVRKKESQRPGRPRVVYRATELAVIDSETWKEFPFSIRAAFTARTLNQMGERLGPALESGTFDSRPDRFLTMRQLELDEVGWGKVDKEMTACLRALTQEQTDAKIRLAKSGELPSLMTVALAGFESPRILPGPYLVQPAGLPFEKPVLRLNHPVPLTTRLARVFSDSLNLEIMWRLDEAVLSATELHAKVGGASIWTFDKRLKLLVDLGWLVSVEKKTGGKRRGATEIFYRATGPEVPDAEVWSAISPGAKTAASWPTVDRFCRSASDALRAGTFDRRFDRYLSWINLLVDQQGWSQVLARLAQCQDASLRLEAESKSRNPRAKELPVLATCFIAGFESPPGPPRTI